MNWIAKQSYYKVERELSNLEQKTVVYNRWIYLYKEKVVTQYREFPIKEVLDISYRQMGDRGGLLYLHTRQGVYSYLVSDDPRPFIDKFKSFR